MRHIVIGSLILSGVLSAGAVAQQRAIVAGKPQQADASAFGAPLTDYVPSAVADAQRKAKNERHEKFLRFVLPEPRKSGFVTRTAHWWQGLPALPVAQSDAVVIGVVRDARAFVTPNRRGVYSEFTIAVQEVVKGRGISGTLVAERTGGAVRHANGLVDVVRLAGQGLPRAGVRYAFFLARNAQDYTIVTAYALDGGTVTPLDGAGAQLVFAAYDGADEAQFLATLRGEVKR